MLNILVGILVFISLFLASFAAFAFLRRKGSPVRLPLMGLLITLSVYSGCYAGELLSANLDRMLVWNRAEYLGIAFLPALWILFTARYVNARWIQNRRVVSALFTLGCVTLFAALTDPALGLRYSRVWISDAGPFPVLGFARGPLYWFHTAYSFISFGIGTWLLLRSLITSPRFFRGQQSFVLVGSVIPWINYAMYLSRFSPWGIDTIPFSMFLSVVCFGIAIFGYGILDVKPIARETVFETMSDGVIVLDAFGRIVDYNRAAQAVFPALTADVYTREIHDALSANLSFCLGLSGEGDYGFDFTVGAGESLRYYQCKVSRVFAKPGAAAFGQVVLFKDNTDSTLLVEKLRELATIDPLTRIFNRRYFMEIAGRQLARHARDKKPLAILILDLDFFKRVNDTYGHLAGDEVLLSVARILSSELRSGDIAARFGGEEFICLMPETSCGNALMVAERVRETIRKNCVRLPGVADVSVSASIGLYCHERVMGDEALDMLIARADIALYRAKALGRNRTEAYSPELEVGP